jgi:hypothetical protein
MVRAEHTPLRLMWLIAILASTSCCAFMIHNTFAQYFDYETTSKIEVVSTSALTMPAITLCSTNYFASPNAIPIIQSE